MTKLKRLLYSAAVIPCAFLLMYVTSVEAATPASINLVNVPAPAAGEMQGIITQITSNSIVVGALVVRFDGDTVMNYNGGLTEPLVGSIVNYSYFVEPDGTPVATEINFYPTDEVRGSSLIRGVSVGPNLNISNVLTATVTVNLENGVTLHWYQPYYLANPTTYIRANIPFNYVGYVNVLDGTVLPTSVSVYGIIDPPPVGDTVAPVITMNGTDVTITEGDVYVDAGATCIDDVDATCAVVTTGTVDSSVVGQYTITYSAKDTAGNVAANVSRLVTVEAAPVVVPPIVLCSGIDQVITNAANARAGIVEINGGPSNGGLLVQLFQTTTTIVAPLTASTFFQVGNLVSFSGTLSADTLCVTTSATVSAPLDTVAPVITMNGTDVTITEGDVYVDAGATCVDDVDATCTVTTSSTVDATTVGIYTVTYGATDVAGNSATPVVRSVIVNKAVTPPTDNVVSTGKKAEGKGIITAITPTTIMIGTKVVRLTATTIVKLEHKEPLKVGDKVEFKGVKNTDGSVTASSVKIQ